MPDSNNDSDRQLAAAYRAQIRHLSDHVAAGRPQTGWKVGVTSAATRAATGLTEPIAGFLLRQNELQSPAVVAHDSLTRPRIECELCFTLAGELRGGDVTLSDVIAATATVQPAFEIVEDRVRGSIEEVIEDNSQQWGYVVGDPVDAKALDLSQVTMEVLNDGVVVQTGVSSDVLGHPANSVAWLVGHLARYGRGLSAGERIMSGSLGTQLKVGEGTTLEARFASVGSVSVTFV
jgi:2-keto-4-pentenoate hydratase